MNMRAAELSHAVRDGDWSLLEWDPQRGRTTWVMFDGEKTVVRHDYEVSKTLERNAALRSNASDGWKGDYHHIASVPLNLLHDQNTGLNEAMRQGDDKHVSRWLNDSDNAKWRTKGGTV